MNVLHALLEIHTAGSSRQPPINPFTQVQAPTYILVICRVITMAHITVPVHHWMMIPEACSNIPSWQYIQMFGIHM